MPQRCQGLMIGQTMCRAHGGRQLPVDNPTSAGPGENCQRTVVKGVQMHSFGGGPSSQQRTMSGSWNTKVRVLTGTACTGREQTQPRLRGDERSVHGRNAVTGH